MTPDQIKAALNICPVNMQIDEPLFCKLTYPRYARWFNGEEKTPDNVLSSVVLLGNMPIGLAIIKLKKKGAAQLLSIMVVATFQRMGIGTLLLQHMEDRARAAKMTQFETHYSDRVDRTPVVSLLQHCGWSQPEHLEHRISAYCDWPKRMGANWKAMVKRCLRNGFSATPWFDISEKEREKALLMETEQVNPDWPRFALFEPESNPLLSVALRQYGELVGWIHCQSIPQEGYHHYVTGFVTRELQPRGWLLAGMDMIVLKQCEIYGPESLSVYETPASSPGMRAIMEKHFNEACLWMDDRYSCQKFLTTT
ncbi:GNAT family N-acetyltransferase [Terasakiella sp.]|uniref:GNAT family N-acetyltransferase n=1 Tax=Terasakiella sp. TaxID=2034861 RepID=UPI003AA818B5